MTHYELDEIRRDMARRGLQADGIEDDDLRKLVGGMGNMFRDMAPLTAADAAKIILDGVRAGKWRILVGQDAKKLDELPENVRLGHNEDAFLGGFRLWVPTQRTR